MSLIDRIAALLRQHVGRESLISARAIARRLRLPQKDAARLVRDEIANEDWLSREMLVVAIPGAGYFLAADQEEAANYDSVLFKLKVTADSKWKRFRAACHAAGIHLGSTKP